MRLLFWRKFKAECYSTFDKDGFRFHKNAWYRVKWNGKRYKAKVTKTKWIDLSSEEFSERFFICV